MITHTAGARSYKQPQDSVVGSLKEVWTQDDGTVRRSERKNKQTLGMDVSGGDRGAGIGEITQKTQH